MSKAWNYYEKISIAQAKYLKSKSLLSYQRLTKSLLTHLESKHQIDFSKANFIDVEAESSIPHALEKCISERRGDVHLFEKFISSRGETGLMTEFYAAK